MPKTQFLIDSFASIVTAFDFRKLRSGYSGNAIRVLRTSDNTEQDFPFVNNEVVGADVQDFVGYNLWSYSEQMQQSVWAKTNVTVTTDTIVAPDGLTTGDVLFETVTNGSHFFYRALSVKANTDYKFSFWVKAEGRDFFYIRASTNLSNNITQPVASFDLTTGTKISDNGLFAVAPTITPVGGNWYKIEYGLKAISTTSSTVIQLNLSTDGTTSSYVGDVTKGVAVWGLQVTESSTVLPYRKTDANPEGYGSLSKAYNQATGGDDLINSTIIRQPIIVNSSALITDGGKLALQGGSTLGLRSVGTIALSAYSELSFTFGVNVNDVTTVQNLFETSSNFNSNNGAMRVFIQLGVLYVSQRRTSLTFSTFMVKSYPISIGRQLITVRFRTGQTATDASQVWINGVEISGTVVFNNPSVALSNQVIYLFARNANTVGFLGKYQNFTMFTDEAQRPGIETNINNYYGYY